MLSHPDSIDFVTFAAARSLLMRLPKPIAALTALLKKPASPRAAAQSRHLEIIVARPGHPAHTLRLNLDAIRRAALWAGAAALLWLTVTAYMAWTQVSNVDAQARADRLAARAAAAQSANAQLKAENSAMTDTLLGLKQRVDALASTLHGFVNQRAKEFPLERSDTKNQGGIAQPMDAAHAAAMITDEAALVAERLDQLLPQARRIAAHEAARPMGEPLTNDPRMTSDYGLRRDPMGKGLEFHNGIDFEALIGTPVHATADGVVESAGPRAGYGNCVVLDHAYGYRSLFGHLSKVLVKPGQKVERGEVIALSGNTGRSTGPHLHYTLFYGDKTIDPEPYVDLHQ